MHAGTAPLSQQTISNHNMHVGIVKDCTACPLKYDGDAVIG